MNSGHLLRPFGSKMRLSPQWLLNRSAFERQTADNGNQKIDGRNKENDFHHAENQQHHCRYQ